MTQGGELSDALALETVEFNSSLSKAATESETEVKTLERELAAKGISQSGARHLRELEIRFAKMATGVIDRAISKRIELGRRIPELLTEPHLNRLRDKLHHHMDSMVKGQETRIALGGHSIGAASASLVRHAQQKAYATKAGITQRLEALRLEARLGMHQQEKPVTLNISNSTVANLNLGTVVGDLNASVQTLNNSGQKELVALVQKLAEAIAASAEIQDAQRKDLLEYLSVVSTETALPPDKRKMAPLKLSIAFLREALSNVANLATLWSGAEQILKTMGVLP